MKKTVLSIAAVCMISAVSMAHANSDSPSVFDNIGVSAKIGTTGPGVDLAFPVNDSFKVRAGYSQYKYSDTVTKENITYDGELKVGGWNILGDWHPSNGGFRVTGGIYSPDHSIGGSARYTGGGTIDLNGVTYSASDLASLKMSSKWNKVSPYLGLGYDGFNSSKNGGFYFTADAGVIFTGSPKVKLSADCLNAAICDMAKKDLSAEETKLNEDLKSIKVMPVVQVGLGYRF